MLVVACNAKRTRRASVSASASALNHARHGHITHGRKPRLVAFYRRAQVYLAQEAYDRALAEWNKSGGLRKSAIGFALLGSIYAAQGKKENALAELEKALAAGYRDFAYLDASPYFDSLRSDPRFQSLLRRMNFPEKAAH